MTARQEYDVLLKTGALLDLYPNLSGEWTKDSKRYESIFEKNQAILYMGVDIDEDYDPWRDDDDY